MIERGHDLSIERQCFLLSIWRSGLYYSPRPESEENLEIMRWMDEQYMKTPFYGYRKLRDELQKKYSIAKTRVQRLMTLVGWQTLYRKPKLSLRNKQHPVYPYLLKDLEITRANQVWAIDITYVPMRRGFLYLCAIIDVHTRYVIHWSLRNTMSAQWCRMVAEEAIAAYGKPEIINSDQGSQFTSYEYTGLLLELGVAISMDGKGRAIDNIFIERLWRSLKYECIYLNVFEDGVQLYEGIKNYFQFYNNERSHQSLNYQTPASRYLRAA